MQRNDAKIVRWMINVRPEDRISAEELKNGMTLNSSRECLQNTYNVGHLERWKREFGS